jgi:hypothetical protein
MNFSINAVEKVKITKPIIDIENEIKIKNDKDN